MKCAEKSEAKCDHLAEILVRPHDIEKAVARVVAELRNAYDQTDQIVALVLLKGAKWFAEDLFSQLGDDRFESFEFKAASYHGDTRSSGTVQTDTELPCEVQGRSVLIIDDIYDSGRTLHHMIERLRQAGAADIKTCVMFEKQCSHAKTLNLDFCGLTVPDRFLVGYGLDFEDRYRELRCVGVLPEHIDL